MQTGVALLAYTLPTLVMPPVGEKLSLRYHPGFVIPAGLSLIGAGFLLMALGSHSSQPGWWILPGCIIAGVGLGLPNTPVANTITAAVSSERAGMASGTDMSARMTSLAFSIALMGLVLVEGVATHLSEALAVADGDALRQFTEKISAGDMAALDRQALLPQADVAAGTLQAALLSGFGWVMAYGAGSALILAAISLLLFSPWKAREAPDSALTLREIR